ncbi:hypothetical protein SAMN05421690_10516 [Nitrosomonas sp. Nm51]|nr:hypothetical protein SAMN05421690_10516 [Nitrosomonas sp. Nm51]
MKRRWMQITAHCIYEQFTNERLITAGLLVKGEVEEV